MLYVIALIKNNAAVKTVATRVFSTEDKAYKDVEIDTLIIHNKESAKTALKSTIGISMFSRV